jgi:hypothetical protein
MTGGWVESSSSGSAHHERRVLKTDQPVRISLMTFNDSKARAVSAATRIASSCGKSILLRRSSSTGRVFDLLRSLDVSDGEVDGMEVEACWGNSIN